MPLLPAYYTTTQYSRRKKKVNPKKYETEWRKHNKFLKSMHLGVLSRSPRNLILGNQNQYIADRSSTYPAMEYRVSQIRPKRWMTTNKRSVRTISLVRHTIRVDIRYFLRSRQMTRIQENVDKSMTYEGG